MSHDHRHERGRRWVRDGGTGQWLRQFGAFTTRFTLELVRNKVVLFWALLFPAGFYLLTITVFLDTGEIPGDLLPYVTAGTAVTYGLFGAIIGLLTTYGPQLAADLESGRYRYYRSLPIAPSADLCGRVAAGFVLTVLAVLAVVAVGLAVGGEFGLRSVASVPVVLVALASYAVFWMVVAVGVAALVTDSRYASVITVSLAMAAYFLTGFNGGDPTAFQGPSWLLNWLPNTLGSRLVTHHLVVPPTGTVSGPPGSIGPPGTVFGIALLGLYTVVALAVGLVLMRTVFYARGVRR